MSDMIGFNDAAHLSVVFCRVVLTFWYFGTDGAHFLPSFTQFALYTSHLTSTTRVLLYLLYICMCVYICIFSAMQKG